MTAAAADAFLLLRLRARLMSRLLLSNFTAAELRSAPYRLAFVGLLALLGMFTVSTSLGFLFVRALQGQPAGPFFLPAMSWAASAAAVGIFFYAGLTLAAALTHRNDVTMLLLSPLSPRVVLGDRLLAVSASFSTLLVIVGIPNLFGVGHALNAGWPFYASCLLTLALLPIAPCAAGLLLVVLVLRWFPPRLARRMSALACGLAASIVYLVAEGKGVMLSAHGQHWQALPTAWTGQALVAAGSGRNSTALVYLAGTAVFSFVLVFLAASAAARLLRSGWGSYTEVSRRHAELESSDDSLVFGPLSPPPPCSSPLPALLRKEWLGLKRDPKLLAQLAYPLVLEGFTLYKTIGNPFTAHAVTGRLERLFAGALYLSGTLTALFLLTILALPMVSREGRSLYLLAIAPVRSKDILLAKILFCAAPVLLILESLLTTAGARLLRLSPAETLFDAVVLAALVLALAAWLVCVGIVWPRLSADGSRRQIHGTALLVGPASGVVLCSFVGYQLGVIFTAAPKHIWVQPVAAASIFLVTGGILIGVRLAGPRLLRDLLSGDRRPG
jgi:hypothetical protein